MFETLKRLYLQGNLSDAQLNRAVQKYWINEKQRKQIIAKAATR